MSEKMDYNHNCCHKQEVKKGIWSEEEDQKLIDYINANGFKNWSVIPILAGLQRCGKSCRLRWLNYLRPDVKRGNFTQEENRLIIQLHKVIGNKWAKIASYLPGRTDNEVKNYWNSTIKKQLLRKKKQNTTTTSISSVVASPVTIPTPTTIASATNRGGGGSRGGGSSCNNRVSYSSAPPPPKTFKEFGSSSNSTANNHHMNVNANAINPEVLVPTPSMLQTPPPFQPTWTSNNNNYPLDFNFNQISQGESFVPFMFPDITPSQEILDWNFPIYHYENNHDSSMMMMGDAQEINNTSILTSGDGMDFLDTSFSPFPPEPSPPSSASSFLEDETYALINNPFNHPENPNTNMFGF